MCGPNNTTLGRADSDAVASQARSWPAQSASRSPQSTKARRTTWAGGRSAGLSTRVRDDPARSNALAMRLAKSSSRETSAAINARWPQVPKIEMSAAVLRLHRLVGRLDVDTSRELVHSGAGRCHPRCIAQCAWGTRPRRLARAPRPNARDRSPRGARDPGPSLPHAPEARRTSIRRLARRGTCSRDHRSRSDDGSRPRECRAGT